MATPSGSTGWKEVLYTRISAPISPYTVVSFLHDHGAVIRLSPILAHYEPKAKPGQSPGYQTYTIYQRIPLLPFGLAIKEIAFKATFEDTIHGLLTQLHAPMGMACDALYEVINVQEEHRKVGRENVRDGHGEIIQHGWILKETVTAQWRFQDEEMLDSRREMTRRMMDEIRRRNSAFIIQPDR